MTRCRRKTAFFTGSLVFIAFASLFAQFPASYDLRSVNGGTQAWVPEVQNQGAAEDCWTFAAATAMNSNLLKTGLLPASPVPPPISISSWHLSTNNGAPDQLLASEAFSATSNWSGFNYQALGYVTRGSGQWKVPDRPRDVIPGVGFLYQQTMGGGPVLDSQNPLNPFPASISERSGYPAYLGSLVPAANQPIAYRVGSMRFHDQGYSNNVPFPSPTGTTIYNLAGRDTSIDTFTFDQGAADPQVAAVKNAILANGAATTNMNADGNFQYGVGASGNITQYFNNQTAPAWLTHSVTIIGWDDDYTMTDPSTSATTTGAWLVQMSNGVTKNYDGTFGYDGTFWASYNDAVIGRVGVSTFTMLDNAPYSSTVIQNELGPTDITSHFDSIWAGPPTTNLPIPSGMPTVAHHTAAAVLTPASDGELRALGLFTQLADVLVDVAIYETWDNGPSGFLGGGNYTLDDIGYFQVELPESLTLTAADSIVVQLTYLDALTLDPALGALGITIGGSGLNYDTNTNSVASGLSYYLDGSAWTDFATLEYPKDIGPPVTGGVLFLKGITAVPTGAYTWIGGNGTGWNSAPNWASNDTPPTGGTVHFSAANQTAIDTQTDQSLGGMVFDAGAPAYTISNNTITLSGNILNNSASTQTINSNLVLENQPAFIAAGGNLAIGGEVSFGTNGTLLAIGGNYATTVSGRISGNGIVSVASGGDVIFSGNNTHTLGTAMISGTLHALSPNALGSGSARLIGGSLAIGANTTLAVSRLDWASTSSTITLAGGAKIEISGHLFSYWNDNRTFQLDPGALQVGANTLFTFDSTDFSASQFALAPVANMSIDGTFQIIGNNLVFVLVGGTSSGNTIADTTPAWSGFTVAGNVSTIGATRTINALEFIDNSRLAIQSGGQLTVSTGSMNVQSGRSVVTGGTLVTPGNLNKTGAGELDLQSDTLVSGTASIDAGLLSVNGNLLANSLLVNQGGTLGGSGTIFAPVTVSGTLAPGNSPGTLSVASLTLTPTAVTDIEIESLTNFDRIVVGGAATVDGTLNVIPYNGNPLAYGQQYNFLTATGGISGEFDTITAPETFRGRFLNGGTTGTLLIAPDTYTRVAVTPNQRSVAKALDKFIPATSGDRETVSIAFDLLTAEQYPAAFEQIMPGFYESLADMSIEQAFTQTQQLNQRMGAVRAGIQSFQAIGLQNEPLKHDRDGKSVADAKTASPIVEDAVSTNWNSWVMGTGSFSRSYNLSEAPGYKNDAGGFLAGADYRWSEAFSTGLYAGYQYNYAKYSGGSSTRGNSALFGAYASWQNEDGYYVNSVIGGGYTGYQTRRSIEFSTIDRTARANPNSGQFSAALNLGKDFEFGNWTVGPILGGQYTYAGVGGFAETGADSLDLALGQQNANSLRSTLGGRVAYTWEVAEKITLIPEARMLWMHEFLNNPRNINAALDGGSGPSFGYETGAPYRNSVFAGAGLSAQIGEQWNASVFYNVNFGAQTYLQNSISASLNFAF